MRLIRQSILYFVTGLIIFGCVEPYAPTSIANAPSLLVVDGFLNASDGTARVVLSRTISLSNTEAPPMEINAGVSLETNEGDAFMLNEVLPGQYFAEEIAVNNELKYRLRINTGGQEYLSDFVPVKVTPAIESIDIHPDPEEMRVTVTTNDPSAESVYYRWKFSETFEYTAPFSSFYVLYTQEDTQRVRSRQPDEYINRCWRTDRSTPILVGTSSGFTQDRITDFELTKIPRASLELSTLYSIQVEQQALTPEGYAYWLGLYKTTEEVGGLFDPLPGQVTGNIYNAANSKEVVVGFFNAATVETLRIFVDKSALPLNYSTYVQPYCELDTLGIENVPIASPRLILYSAIYSPWGLIGYTYSDPLCIDCRYHGGDTTKPDFWP